MKRTSLLLILFLTTSLIATAQHGGHRHGGGMDRHNQMDSLQQVTLTGTFLIVQDTSRAGSHYWLDTNGDGVGDYRLMLGRHIPTGVTLPSNGQTVTVVGGLVTRITPNGIMVLTIDGTLMRDTTRIGHRGGKRHGFNLDSLQDISTTGVVTLVQDTARVGHTFYYIDVNGDGVADYRLLLGPSWYTPSSGATFPTQGQTVTITGKLITTQTPNGIIVLTLDGKIWRDTTRVGHRGGRITHGMGEAIQCRMDTSNIPGWTRGYAEGYRVQVTNMRNENMMHGGRMQFNKPATITITYDESNFANEAQLVPWRYQNNTWISVSEFTLDTKANTLTFVENPVYEYYAVFPKSTTSVLSTEAPDAATLEVTYPNPVTATTATIRYALTTAAPVRLSIFDVTGRLVGEYDNGFQNAGSYSTTIDVSNLITGAYFYQLNVGSQVFMKKFSVVK